MSGSVDLKSPREIRDDIDSLALIDHHQKVQPFRTRNDKIKTQYNSTNKAYSCFNSIKRDLLPTSESTKKYLLRIPW